MINWFKNLFRRRPKNKHTVQEAIDFLNKRNLRDAGHSTRPKPFAVTWEEWEALAVLGIQGDTAVNNDKISIAYRDMAARHHPDKYDAIHAVTCESNMKRTNHARDVLVAMMQRFHAR